MIWKMVVYIAGITLIGFGLRYLGLTDVSLGISRMFLCVAGIFLFPTNWVINGG